MHIAWTVVEIVGSILAFLTFLGWIGTKLVEWEHNARQRMTERRRAKAIQLEISLAAYEESKQITSEQLVEEYGVPSTIFRSPLFEEVKMLYDLTNETSEVKEAVFVISREDFLEELSAFEFEYVFKDNEGFHVPCSFVVGDHGQFNSAVLVQNDRYYIAANGKRGSSVRVFENTGRGYEQFLQDYNKAISEQLETRLK